MKKQQTFQNKIAASTILFILIIAASSLFVVYYWSFYHFSKIFEDRVIDEYTFQKKQDMGIKNEWILGVTTDSIDVVESIHKDKVARIIQERAEKQTEPEKLYRETIDGKHLLYVIRLDTEHGETLYHYSIIKDIYAEIFPQIVLSFLTFSIILVGISIWYTRTIGKEMYTDIARLRTYTRKITHGKKADPVEIKTKDPEFRNLLSDLEIMKDTIDKDAAMRQTTLEYISHEMKTPIMIIEGYASSAMNEIYPKGSLQDSLETIMKQTERMKQKVQDLLTIVRLESTNVKENAETICVQECLLDVLQSLENQLQNKKSHIEIDSDIFIRGNREKVKILFENLITNQVKYSNTYFSVSCKKKNDQIYMYFYNDGAPIAPELHDTLFQPFVKGYNGSSGLGLSICKTIMDQMEGNICLVDTKIGTLFQLKFPDIQH